MVIERVNKKSIDIIKNYLPQDITESVYDREITIFVAMEDEVVIAVMVVRENAKVAQIGYISVADDYRQQGICTNMICDYMWGCAERGIAKLTCTLGNDESDKYVERVLIELGFVTDFTWNSIITTTVGEFCRCELPKVSLKEHVIMDFNELGKEGIGQVARVIKANTAFRFTEDDLMKCNYELSIVIIVNSVIKDVVLVREDDDTLELICMYSAKDDMSGTVILLNELKRRVEDSAKYIDKKVLIPSVNEASQKLVTHILPNCTFEFLNKMIYEFE